jgi:hypothetical protein
MRDIMAVDPGGMTGWAAITRNETVSSGELPAWDFVKWFDGWPGKPELVVCESFIITQRTAKLSQQTISLEVIGALKYLCMRDGIDFELQKPAEAKGFDPKGVRLKQLGWWPTSSDHAQDAARHLLLGVVRHKLIDPRRLVVG